MIIIHFGETVKEYVEADICPGKVISPPAQCPGCGAEGGMIRWGSYWRSALTGEADYRIQIQRVRCQGRGKTQALLPDFLHSHRHYSFNLLQLAVMLYLVAGVGFERLWWDIYSKLGSLGPALSTVRDAKRFLLQWVGSFGWGAGFLLLDVLRRLAMRLWPGSDVGPDKPPPHLERSHNSKLLGNAYHFLKWGDTSASLNTRIIYAHHKVIAPETDFSNAKMLPYLLHILQSSGLPPRIFWNPSLKTTPSAPF